MRLRKLLPTYLMASAYAFLLVLPLFTLLSASLRAEGDLYACLLYTSPSPRDRQKSRMPSSA